MKEISSKFVKTRHTFLSSNCKYIYHIGLIDYLQDYNLSKIMENRAKTFINSKGAQELISSIEPRGYLTRFNKYMQAKVIID